MCMIRLPRVTCFPTRTKDQGMDVIPVAQLSLTLDFLLILSSLKFIVLHSVTFDYRLDFLAAAEEVAIQRAGSAFENELVDFIGSFAAD